MIVCVALRNYELWVGWGPQMEPEYRKFAVLIGLAMAFMAMAVGAAPVVERLADVTPAIEQARSALEQLKLSLPGKSSPILELGIFAGLSVIVLYQLYSVLGRQVSSNSATDQLPSYLSDAYLRKRSGAAQNASGLALALLAAGMIFERPELIPLAIGLVVLIWGDTLLLLWRVYAGHFCDNPYELEELIDFLQEDGRPRPPSERLLRPAGVGQTTDHASDVDGVRGTA